MIRQTLCRAGLLGVLGVVLATPSSASAAEPVPFATASAPCSSGKIVFPVQSVAHSSIVYFFRSIGSQGAFEFGPSFEPGDSGWAGRGIDDVEAGVAPELELNCSGGSVEASLADRPSTPATFSAVSSPPNGEAELPFSAPGSGQYVVDVAMTQGAIWIEGVPGIIQSSGEYSLGSLSVGEFNPRGEYSLTVDPQPGPPAIWTATVREVPVAINKLGFDQPCITAGTGIPATFSVTGNTTISATVSNSSGQVVRNLGTFPVKQGSGSIPWDGRDSTGGAVPTGSYTLNLLSADPSGNQTSAQAGIYVDASGPSISMTSPKTILPSESASFQVVDPGCGVASAVITVEDEGGEQEAGASFGEYGPPLPANGAVLVSPQTPWNPGRYKWSAKVASKAGSARTVTGSFRVVNSLPPKSCVVPRVAGRTVAAAKKLLRKHGCQIGKIVRRQAKGVRVGRVIRSRPHIHARKRLHSKVTLVVAK